MGKKKPERTGIERYYDMLMDSPFFGDREESDRAVRSTLDGYELLLPDTGYLLYALAILGRQEQILLAAADGGDLTTADNSLWQDLLKSRDEQLDHFVHINGWIERAALASEDSTWGIILPASCRLAARVLTGRAGGRFAEPGGS